MSNAKKKLFCFAKTARLVEKKFLELTTYPSNSIYAYGAVVVVYGGEF